MGRWAFTPAKAGVWPKALSEGVQPFARRTVLRQAAKTDRAPFENPEGARFFTFVVRRKVLLPDGIQPHGHFEDFHHVRDRDRAVVVGIGGIEYCNRRIAVGMVLRI